MNLYQKLANLEQQLLTQEHYARHNIGRLDRRYLDHQKRRRNITLALMREYQREIAALRAQLGEREAGVVLKLIDEAERTYLALLDGSLDQGEYKALGRAIEAAKEDVLKARLGERSEVDVVLTVDGFMER